jgi:hypothetical protein
MGLMNVGRSEGSEIIQLFGRGVRLKGYKYSLKRSTALDSSYNPGNLPKGLREIETLNIFGVRADYMDTFRKYLEGKQQEVLIGEINGFEFKARLDVLGDGWIADLKTCESITKRYFSEGWWNFIDYWGYPLQGAIYQELVYQNTGKRLPFYIAAISKEPSPDLGIFRIPQENLDIALAELDHDTLARIDALKHGEIDPERCEHCDYCRATKVITKPVNYTMIWEDSNG